MAARRMPARFSHAKPVSNRHHEERSCETARRRICVAAFYVVELTRPAVTLARRIDRWLLEATVYRPAWQAWNVHTLPFPAPGQL